MPQTQIVVAGTIQADGTLRLSQPVALPAGPVEVTIRAVPQAREDTWALLERIWADREARGVQPRTREEIDAEIDAMREESEGRMREIEKLYDEARRTRESPPC